MSCRERPHVGGGASLHTWKSAAQENLVLHAARLEGSAFGLRLTMGLTRRDFSLTGDLPVLASPSETDGHGGDEAGGP
jgi:hypothetical protein